MSSAIAVAEREPVTHGVTGRSARIANVERLRILAIFDIIGFHAGQERTLLLGGIGLATFLILTHLFNCIVANKRGFPAFARSKAKRLVWPWLFWCAVYAAWLTIHAYRHDTLSTVFSPWMLLYGTKDHLWFVPFALVSGIAVGWVQNATARRSDSLVIAVSAVLGGTIVLASAAGLIVVGGMPVPVPQYLYASASPFLGFAIGRATLIREVGAKRRAFALLSIGGIGYAFGFLALVQWIPLHYMVLRYAVMTVVIIAALTWPGHEDALTRRSIPLMFGVYLVHPLVIAILYRFDALHQHVFLYAILVFVLSNLIIWIMQRTPLKIFT